MTMLTDPKLLSLLVGGVATVYLLGALVWSIALPEKRVWPPEKATTTIKLRAWAATIAIFAATFLLGVADWNNLEWPAPVRWGIGLALIVVGNIIVWRGVMKIGLDATSGKVDDLKTGALCAWSRNPQ